MSTNIIFGKYKDLTFEECKNKKSSKQYVSFLKGYINNYGKTFSTLKFTNCLDLYRYLLENDNKECEICCLPQKEFIECPTCNNQICNDCNTKVKYVKSDYDTIYYQCPYCRCLSFEDTNTIISNINEIDDIRKYSITFIDYMEYIRTMEIICKQYGL